MAFIEGFADPSSDQSRGLEALNKAASRFAEGFAKDPSVRTQEKIVRIKREDRDNRSREIRIKQSIDSINQLGVFALAIFKETGKPTPPGVLKLFKKMGSQSDQAGELANNYLAALSKLQEQPAEDDRNFAAGFGPDPNDPNRAAPLPGGSRDPETIQREATLRAAASQEAQGVSRVISSDDPINKEFNLGIPDGESAFVNFRQDPVTGAVAPSVTKRFGASSPIEINLAGLSDKERRKELEGFRSDLRDRRSAVISLVRQSNRIDEILGDSAEAIGVIGGIARLGDTMVEQARAIGKQFGLSLSPDDYEEVFNKHFAQIAEMSSAVRSNIINLAFTVARAQNKSGRVTEKDVQFALQTIGANSGSTKQIRAALGEVVNNAIQSFDDDVFVNRGRFEEGELPIPQSMTDDLKLLGVTPIERINVIPQAIKDVGGKLHNVRPDGTVEYELPNGMIVEAE